MTNNLRKAIARTATHRRTYTAASPPPPCSLCPCHAHWQKRSISLAVCCLYLPINALCLEATHTHQVPLYFLSLILFMLHCNSCLPHTVATLPCLPHVASRVCATACLLFLAANVALFKAAKCFLFHLGTF